MVTILFILSVFINIFAAGLLFTRAKSVAVYVLFGYYFFIDYFNYLIGLDAGLIGYVSKIYPDVFFAFLSIYFIAKVNSEGDLRQFIPVFIGLAVACLYMAVAIIKGVSVGTAFLDFRSCVVPILMAYMLVRADILDSYKLNLVLKLCGYLILFNALLAIFQYYNFDGLPESSWRFDFLQELNLRKNADYETRMVVYQIVRDDNLRASGLFVSALTFSFLAAYYCVFYIISLFESKLEVRNLIKYTFYICVLLSGIYCSQVRTSLIIVFISMFFLAFFVSKRVDGIKFKAKSALLSASSLAIATFVLIIFLGERALDASSFGRVNQYLTLMGNFNAVGYGLGSYKMTFDSFYIYGLMTFGIIFAIYFVYSLILYLRAFNHFNITLPDLGVSDSLIVKLGFVSIPTLIYVMSIQHTEGSIFYFVNLLVLSSVCHIHKVNQIKNYDYHISVQN